MFDELDKYKKNGHFFLRSDDNIYKVCNAPGDKAGVYIIYALKGGSIDMVFISSAGQIEQNGSFLIPPGGLKGKIISDGDFLLGKIKRGNIEALDICWYVTHGTKYIDSPKQVESAILRKHKEIYGRIPLWNK